MARPAAVPEVPVDQSLPIVIACAVELEREASAAPDRAHAVDAVLAGPAMQRLVELLVDLDGFDEALSVEMDEADALEGLAPLRQLTFALALPVRSVLRLLGDVAGAADHPATAAGLHRLASGLLDAGRGTEALRDALRATGRRAFYEQLVDRLTSESPHAVFPTSPFRRSGGHLVVTDDDHLTDAVMTTTTSTTVRVATDVLDVADHHLADLFAGTGRCVAFVDANVEALHGERLGDYFAAHGIDLQRRVHRAMEIDKGLRTVERMVGDLRELGVRRDEPVLLVGGGVLSDVGGLACALYHRNTPYVMLSTSVVAGIDAGPSPRTCCDGYGFKNLVGAYHPPIVSITDPTFYATLRAGWLRHGVAEIVKMAVVEDARLFAAVEAAGVDLVDTRFGTVGSPAQLARLGDAPQRILGGAIRSYVGSEYGNLYETHQCRPHAYGHTWSPGFEIAAGLLHGHAVSIDMGFGALVSHRHGWIDETAMRRILVLLSDLGLSLWHDVLDDTELVWAAQRKAEEKRGGQLVAPLPRGGIGRCGYLEHMARAELVATIDDYRALVGTFPRRGRGVEPLCLDVGLEDPSTVAHDGDLADQPVPIA